MGALEKSPMTHGSACCSSVLSLGSVLESAHQFGQHTEWDDVRWKVFVARVTCHLCAVQQSLRGVFCARNRGSSKSPCRAVRLVNFPRDGHGP